MVFQAVGLNGGSALACPSIVPARRDEGGSGHGLRVSHFSPFFPGTDFNAENAEACPERAERVEGTQRKMEIGEQFDCGLRILRLRSGQVSECGLRIEPREVGAGGERDKRTAGRDRPWHTDRKTHGRARPAVAHNGAGGLNGTGEKGDRHLFAKASGPQAGRRTRREKEPVPLFRGIGDFGLGIERRQRGGRMGGGAERRGRRICLPGCWWRW